MLRKKEPKDKKSIAEALLRDMQGTAAEKLALFEQLRGRGAFAEAMRAEVLKIEKMCGRLRRRRSSKLESALRQDCAEVKGGIRDNK
jgi:hypothetical protein